MRGVGEVRTVRSGARGSDRLQKSTSGVWPRPPRGEEPLGSSRGLALSAQARGANERRKPADGGKAGRTVAGPSQNRAAKAGLSRGTRRGKASWTRDAARFDDLAEEAVLSGRCESVGRPIITLAGDGWGASYLPGFPGRAGRDRGRQRSGFELGTRSTTPRPSDARCVRASPSGEERGETRPKLGECRQTLDHSGPGLRKEAWRRAESTVGRKA